MIIKTGTAIGVILLAGAIFAKTFVIGYYRIPQNGMFPGLPAGSTLLVNKWAYSRPSDVKRGDVVVFVREQPDGRYTYIWRVIGVPGDRVIAAGAAVSVNGRSVLRTNEKTEGGLRICREQLEAATYEIAMGDATGQLPPDVDTRVPPDHFFVMGDNRFDAVDSRYFGPVAFRAIIGKKF